MKDQEENIRLQKRIAGLQKEAAGLQEAMRRAAEGQQPLTQQDLEMLRGTGGGAGSAQAGMILLKTRVFLKTMRDLEEKSGLLMERLDAVLEAPRRGITDGASSGFFDEAVSMRLHSLSVSRAMLLQLQAQARMLAAAYGELEGALVEAGKATDEARAVRLLQAAENARKIIERADQEKRIPSIQLCVI